MHMYGSLAALSMFGDVIIEEFLLKNKVVVKRELVRHLHDQYWMIGTTHCTEKVKDKYLEIIK